MEKAGDHRTQRVSGQRHLRGRATHQEDDLPAHHAGVLRECGETPSDGEVAQLVAQFDDNNNGTVDFDEFCALVTRSRSDSVNSQVESKVAEIAREAIATDEGAAGAPL